MLILLNGRGIAIEHEIKTLLKRINGGINHRIIGQLPNTMAAKDYHLDP